VHRKAGGAKTVRPPPKEVTLYPLLAQYLHDLDKTRIPHLHLPDPMLT
jgi:hypothetical protein